MKAPEIGSLSKDYLIASPGAIYSFPSQAPDPQTKGHMCL